MARIRSLEWETPEYWQSRISKYLSGETQPQMALAPRIAYVALEDKLVVGFVAGHLTRRFGCGGELEWINVIPQCRGRGVASGLLRELAGWFAGQKAVRVCVNVDPGSASAAAFYARHGARALNRHWMCWEDIGPVAENR